MRQSDVLGGLHTVCGHFYHPILQIHTPLNTYPAHRLPCGLCSEAGGVWILKYLTAWHQVWHRVTHVRHGNIKGLLTVLTELCLYTDITVEVREGCRCLGNVNGYLIHLCLHFRCITRNQNLIPHQILPGFKSALCQEEKSIKYPLLCYTEEWGLPIVHDHQNLQLKKYCEPLLYYWSKLIKVQFSHVKVKLT